MKIFDKKVKMPKSAIWLVPGLRVKRWFALIIMGSVLAAIGVTFVFKLAPLYYMVQAAKEIVEFVSAGFVGSFLIGVGAVLFILAWKKTNASLMEADSENRRKNSIGEVIYRKMKLDHGPKIVAIGGGTGLSTLLRGIKKITNIKLSKYVIINLLQKETYWLLSTLLPNE